MYTDALYIPRLLDEPRRYVFFSAFEICSIFAGLLIGQLSQKWLFALIVSIFFFVLTRRADQKGVFDTLSYLTYWYMPDSILKLIQMDYFPKTPSYNRILVG